MRCSGIPGCRIDGVAAGGLKAGWNRRSDRVRVDTAIVVVIFRFPQLERPISNEEAGWLLGQLRSAREFTAPAASAAAKLE